MQTLQIVEVLERHLAQLAAKEHLSLESGSPSLSESRRQTPSIMVDTLSHAAQTKLVGPEHRPQWGINGQGSLSPVSVTPSPSLSSMHTPSMLVKPG